MISRQLFGLAKTSKYVLPALGGRNLSTTGPTGKLVTVEVNDKSGVATLTLNRPPVNSLNLDLLTDICDAIDVLEKNRSRGLILTSSAKTVFSAGLDITEMYKPEQERLQLFWKSVQDVWLKLYGSSFPTAVAIHGHSPAGGCMLSLCCEYRVMCPNFTIGLNETKLGIIAPPFFIAAFRNVLPLRQVEQALTLGKLFSTNEALQVGLIDEIATDKADAIAKCEQFIGQFSKISPVARGTTKLILRRKELDDLRTNREQDLQVFLKTVNDPKVQMGLEMYMQSLKKK